MANLAIKGHATRGKEVIEILEMLGGKNKFHREGDNKERFYYIDEHGCIQITCGSLNYILFDLEQFEEKFPYKVGDKVFVFDNKCTIIDSVWDESIEEVVYTIKLDTSKYTTTKLSNQLQPYKEETMEDKSNLLQQLKEYFENTPREVVEKEWHEYDKYNEIGPKVDEYLEYVNKIRQPQYPKNYDECCAILDYELDGQTVIGYDADLIEDFQTLKLCRDAYWKIAGDWKEKRKVAEMHYIIYSTLSGEVLREDTPFNIPNCLLDFPTKEMRDAFYENFKELIETCKELL